MWKKTESALLLSLGLCLLLPPVYATELQQQNGHELGTHGYLRAGSGDSGDDTQVCYKAPGAGAKYRLGNECEIYGKLSLYYRHQTQKDGAYFHAEVMPEFAGAYGEAVEFTRNVQGWVEMGNIGGSPVDVWAGRRYNFRRDIHINDYFYMNLWGDGVGVRDIPLGAGRLALTYLQDRHVPDGLANHVTQRSFDASLYELETNPGGKVMADVRYARIESEDFGASELHGADGWAVSLQHQQQGVLGGINTAVVQYGRGAGRAAWSSWLESDSALTKLTDPLLADELADANTWRLLDFHLYNGERWAMMSSALVEWRDSESFDGADQVWTSIGARPMYFFDEHWRVVGELGYDRVSGKPYDGNVFKQTLAMEWAPARNFMSRPALRGYITHASWSDSYRGLVAAPTYAADTEGWNVGVQVEVWW